MLFLIFCEIYIMLQYRMFILNMAKVSKNEVNELSQYVLFIYLFF